MSVTLKPLKLRLAGGSRVKVIICGGRSHKLSMADHMLLDDLNDGLTFTKVLSGGCSGVDQAAEEWAKERNIPIEQFIPDWVAEGKKAGPLRNEEMAKQADMCICFPGGRGTRDMMDRAIQHQLLLVIVPGYVDVVP